MEKDAIKEEEIISNDLLWKKADIKEESDISEGSQKHEKLKTALLPYWRERPPTTYSVTFESFGKMMELVNNGYYESLPFTVDGINWTFKIYPNGNSDTTRGLIYLYVKIDDSSITDPPLDVYAEIKFFVYNYGISEYYTYQEVEPVKFDSVQQEWGRWIDVFVAQRNKSEVFSYDENISNPVFTWSLPNFSTLTLDSYTSDPFSSGDRNWVLKVYPNGDGVGKDNSLSLYLLSESNEKNYVRATLRVLNQIGSDNVEKPVEGWPNAAENGWGYQEFIPLADLQDATKGFVVDDLLEVEVEIMAISKQTPIN
ncbi:TRAF-like family protein [Arabidopsis thaliana]|uniref:TRAF-like family protein n=1 Tax=Arabidopsis thaliana TaxID=3702 RepID=A0A1I9LN71_ARATH|nr:TRAF-like family protein [Arabidopsis thaliana]ANM64029.1 TRAF-like family protein [Arabidopsis thaliana]|eukprot:NP_001326080.1 TRAF-like family protein [Arabidopsis thaliana]